MRDVAKGNLHSARAALHTARQRLADATARFDDSVENFFVIAPEITGNLAWWQAEVKKAEAAVAECQRIVLQESGDE